MVVEQCRPPIRTGHLEMDAVFSNRIMILLKSKQNQISHYVKFVFLVFVLLAPATYSFAGNVETTKLTPLIASTPKGNFTYNIELAVSSRQRSRGLMFRRQMPRDYGMLFDFDRTQKVAMWMKNTFLPLDMIFMRADGTIAHIVENTTPHSLSVISSRFPVRFVLELNAGEARNAGLKSGQIMRHAIFLKRGG